MRKFFRKRKDLLVAGQLGAGFYGAVLGIGLSIITGNWIFAGIALSVAAIDLIIRYNTIMILIEE